MPCCLYRGERRGPELARSTGAGPHGGGGHHGPKTSARNQQRSLGQPTHSGARVRHHGTPESCGAPGTSRPLPGEGCETRRGARHDVRRGRSAVAGRSESEIVSSWVILSPNLGATRHNTCRAAVPSLVLHCCIRCSARARH